MAFNHNSNILANSDQFGQFNILDYLENLEIIKETHSDIEIYCPVCQAKNFKIDKKEGKYYGYSCECMEDCQTRKEIVKAVLPTNQGQNRNYSPQPKATRKLQNNPLPVITGPATLAIFEQIPQDRPQRISQGQNSTITYHYSEFQGVDRIETSNPDKPKGYDKSFRQWHINEAGSKIHKKGDVPWPLYRQTEIITGDSWPVLVEGEECVESLREIGIKATTFQGSNWGAEAGENKFRQLKEANVPGLIFIPDLDEAGLKKVRAVLTASAVADFPVIIINIANLWPEVPEKGDVADWITWGKTNNMYNPDYISRLETEMHRAVNERQKLSAPPAIPELTKGQRLKLEIKAWQQETDIAERETRKVDICCHFKINTRAFDAISDSLNLDYSKPKHNKHKISNFMGLPTKGTPILAPGIPATGVTILAGLPGTGKTTLAYDLAGAVMMGDEFLGEVPTQKGSVLFLACDEPYAHVQDKFINRGIASVDSHLGTIITDWNVREWDALELTVDEMRPSLVVIDSFNGIHEDDGFDENCAAASNTIKKLEKLSSRYGVPIVVIHHINKSKENRGVNKLRGSSAIAASCSSILILEGTEGTYKTLSQPKIRGSEPINLTMEADFEFGRFKVVSGNLADEKTKSLAQRLHDFFLLNADTMFEITELREHFPNEDRKVLTNSVNRLVNRGHITKRPSKANLRFKVYGIGSTLDTPAIDFQTLPPLEPLKEFDDNIAKTIDVKGIEPVITVSSPLSSTLKISVITEEIEMVTEQVMTPETIIESEIQPNVINFDHQQGGSVNKVDDDNETVLLENQQIVDETKEEAQPLEWKAVIKEIDTHIEKLGWTKEKARNYVQVTYAKKSRLKLTDAELLEFLHHLQGLVKARK